MDVLVSIICYTYNHENYIEDAIESFLMQKTDFPIEILIHDDASTDNTTNIIRYYEREYPNIIKPIYQVENQYSKKNKVSLIVLPKAKGKYIALCEGDDYWTDSSKLQKQFDFMEDNPECTFCFHAANLVNPDKKLTGKSMLYNRIKNLKYTAGEMAVLGFIPTASQFFRANSIRNLPEWFNYTVVGDYPLQLITTSHGYAHYINEIMSAYRVGQNGSASSRYNNMSTENKVKYIKGFIDILENFNTYSQNKYYKDVDKAIMEREIQIIILEKKIEKLRTTRYKDYYKSLNLKDKSKLYARAYFPKAYIKMAHVKERIRQTMQKL